MKFINMNGKKPSKKDTVFVQKPIFPNLQVSLNHFLPCLVLNPLIQKIRSPKPIRRNSKQIRKHQGIHEGLVTLPWRLYNSSLSLQNARLVVFELKQLHLLAISADIWRIGSRGQESRHGKQRRNRHESHGNRHGSLSHVRFTYLLRLSGMFEAAKFGHKHFAPSMAILAMMHAYQCEGLHEAS